MFDMALEPWRSEINSELERLRLNETGECRHHIIPRSLGGDDTEDNLVWCSNQEHLHIHRLYAKAFPGDIRIQRAHVLMEHLHGSGQFSLDSIRAFSVKGMTIDEFQSKVQDLLNSGHTVNQIAKIMGTTQKSIRRYCQIDKQLEKKNFRKAVSGPKSDSHRKRMRVPKSQSHKKAMSDAWTKRQKFKCSGCGKEAYRHQLTRYHKVCGIEE